MWSQSTKWGSPEPFGYLRANDSVLSQLLPWYLAPKERMFRVKVKAPGQCRVQCHCEQPGVLAQGQGRCEPSSEASWEIRGLSRQKMYMGRGLLVHG